MLEDYRAGLGVDRAADDADRAAGRRLRCPVLVGWSVQDDMPELYGDLLAIWRRWADEHRAACRSTAAITWPSRHRTQLAAALVEFLGRLSHRRMADLRAEQPRHFTAPRTR